MWFIPIYIFIFSLLRNIDAECQPSITTVNGSNSVCAGQLIFFEEFNDFDRNLWKHERYLGVS